MPRWKPSSAKGPSKEKKEKEEFHRQMQDLGQEIRELIKPDVSKHLQRKFNQRKLEDLGFSKAKNQKMPGKTLILRAKADKKNKKTDKQFKKSLLRYHSEGLSRL